MISRTPAEIKDAVERQILWFTDYGDSKRESAKNYSDVFWTIYIGTHNGLLDRLDKLDAIPDSLLDELKKRYKEVAGDEKEVDIKKKLGLIGTARNGRAHYWKGVAKALQEQIKLLASETA